MHFDQKNVPVPTTGLTSMKNVRITLYQDTV